jgi:O-antigen ligase
MKAVAAGKSINKFFVFLFACLLIAQVLLSVRPNEIAFPVLFHVSALGFFLFFGTCAYFVDPNPAPVDRLTLVALVFLAYFYTGGVLVSKLYGGKTFDCIEFPYRIANLFMLLFIPYFVRSEKALKQVFIMLLFMMGVLLVRDLVIGPSDEESIRYVGKEFSSASVLITPAFACAAMVAFWTTTKRRIIVRSLLVILWVLLLTKLFLTFSRAVWLGVFPVNVIGVVYLLKRKYKFGREFRRVAKKAAQIIIFLVVTGLIGIIGVSIYTPKITDFLEYRINKTSPEANARMDEYSNAVREWLESPIWGKGFAYESTFVKGKRTRHQQYVHNLFLQFLMSSGVVGLSLILILLGSIFFQVWKLFNRSQSLLQTAVLIGCLLTVLNIGMQSLVQTVIQKQETYFILAMVISFAIIVKRLQLEEFRSPVFHLTQPVSGPIMVKKVSAGSPGLPGTRQGLPGPNPSLS